MLSGLGKAPKISVENPDRTFPRIQSGADGAVIACSDEKASKDASAGIMALSREAENGVLRIIRRNSDGTGKRPCTVNTAKHKPKAIFVMFPSVTKAALHRTELQYITAENRNTLSSFRLTGSLYICEPIE